VDNRAVSYLVMVLVDPANFLMRVFLALFTCAYSFSPASSSPEAMPGLSLFSDTSPVTRLLGL
jgi:hypothetical protein